MDDLVFMELTDLFPRQLLGFLAKILIDGEVSTIVLTGLHLLAGAAPGAALAVVAPPAGTPIGETDVGLGGKHYFVLEFLVAELGYGQVQLNGLRLVRAGCHVPHHRLQRSSRSGWLWYLLGM